MTSNIKIVYEGQANKDAVAAILARRITQGNAREYLHRVAEKQSRKDGERRDA